MANAKHRKVSLRSFMRTAVFRKGWEDFHKGVWDGDNVPWKQAWQYERARQFAACVPSAPWNAIKQGNRITDAAINAYMRFKKEGAIL